MADLTDLLGNAYSRPEGSRIPEWSEDDRLDAAFEAWHPGPGPDASATERKMFVSSARHIVVEEEPAPSESSVPTMASPVPDLPYANDEDAPSLSPAMEWGNLRPLDFEAPFDPADEEAAGPAAPALPWRREDDNVLCRRPTFRMPSLSLRLPGRG